MKAFSGKLPIILGLVGILLFVSLLAQPWLFLLWAPLGIFLFLKGRKANLNRTSNPQRSGFKKSGYSIFGVALMVVAGLSLIFTAGSFGAKDPVAEETPVALVQAEESVDPNADADKLAADQKAAEEKKAAEDAEVARLAEEQRVATEAENARLAEEQRVAAEAEAARVAAEQEAARVAAEQEAQAQQQAAPPAAPAGGDPKFGSCKEAKANGYGLYTRDVNPEYGFYDDRDGDGIVCE